MEKVNNQGFYIFCGSRKTGWELCDSTDEKSQIKRVVRRQGWRWQSSQVTVQHVKEECRQRAKKGTGKTGV